MKLCFLNPDHHDFNVATPFARPLGGSQSALCYLALALAAAGHEVTLASATSRPLQQGGVNSIVLPAAAGPFLAAQGFDALIVLNRPEYINDLRGRVASSTRLVLWTGHNVNQRALAPLGAQEVRDQWDAFVLVSEWHRTACMNGFRLPAARVKVLRNAVAPAFENLFTSAAQLRAVKTGDPVLAYTSAPFRGLSLLADVYAELAKRDPGIRLRVYSSMAMYQRPETAPLEELYSRVGALERAEHAGSLAQPAVAAALKHCHVLAYPNVFAETSCIAVMEAMAAGCLIVTSDYAALPETTAGFATLVPTAFRSMQEYANDYLRVLAQAVHAWRTDDAAVADHLWRQVNYVNAHCTWARRAAEWDQWLRTL